MSLNCSEISTYEKNAFWNEEHTKSSWYIIENYSKNQKQLFPGLICSVSPPIYREKYTYFLKRVIISLKLFLDSINLKNESARPKLVINGLLVDIKKLFIFLQVEIQVHMAKKYHISLVNIVKSVLLHESNKF